ncbi:E3 ubiquitin-protein ligase Siah1-like [Amblyomma americanum]
MNGCEGTVFFPCQFFMRGCDALLCHTNEAEHEQACEFRPYVCPFPGVTCQWRGSVRQMMSHFVHWHGCTICEGEHLAFLMESINIPCSASWIVVQSCFGHHFILVLEKKERYDGHQQFFADVQLIGSRRQAENFTYRLELIGHKRRLAWEASTRSTHEGVQATSMRSDCLVFDTSMAQRFAESGNLVIEVTIFLKSPARDAMTRRHGPPFIPRTKDKPPSKPGGPSTRKPELPLTVPPPPRADVEKRTGAPPPGSSRTWTQAMIQGSQGAVLSALLFTLAMKKHPTLLGEVPGVQHALYADDITFWGTHGSDWEAALLGCSTVLDQRALVSEARAAAEATVVPD